MADGIAEFDLGGVWDADRVVHDRRQSARAAATGERRFIRIETARDEYDDVERLTVTLDGRAYAASQSYRWRVPVAGPIELWFADGRFFVGFELETRRGRSRGRFRHDCGDDVYDGAITIWGRDDWRMSWVVKGPRKDYRMTTRYRRTVRDADRCDDPRRGSPPRVRRERIAPGQIVGDAPNDR